MGQGDRHLEHALERVDAHALTRLVVALGAIGEIGAWESRGFEGVRVGCPTRDDLSRLVPTVAQSPLGKRDLVSNINWYMNVPIEDDGTLGIVDGISQPGLTVTMRAEMDTLVLVSNCPQINNPCNGFDPTPVRMVVTVPGAV